MRSFISTLLLLSLSLSATAIPGVPNSDSDPTTAKTPTATKTTALSPPVFTLPARNSTTCTTPQGSGTCTHVSRCGSGGFTVKGFCADDSAEFQCCVQKSCVSTAGKKGWCENIAHGCGVGVTGGGKFVEGNSCGGDATVRCCVLNGGEKKEGDKKDKKEKAEEEREKAKDGWKDKVKSRKKKATAKKTKATATTTTKKTKTTAKPKATTTKKKTTKTTKKKTTKKPKATAAAKKKSGAGIVSKAKSQSGLPYSWGGGGCGGKSRGRTGVGFDCSGLTQYAVCAWSKANGKKITIPRVTGDQYNYGKKVLLKNKKAGDLLFWGKPDCSKRANVYHTAVYAGDGKMVAAKRTGTNVGTFKLETANLCPYVVRHWG
ncbi:hypothetical protein EX30DRAFT_375028 [Ascodesmis nigricans]|uniref:NlpC/P60 domain-containing protein n=1 Tax=Ascodesmis nigricans TaxID=341454 RepID=A0A4S2MJI9_9PEZI|nr:hypothetical protein EX30DRAFT_375028 [Ascodesmis nigricans]